MQAGQMPRRVQYVLRRRFRWVPHPCTCSSSAAGPASAKPPLQLINGYALHACGTCAPQTPAGQLLMPSCHRASRRHCFLLARCCVQLPNQDVDPQGFCRATHLTYTAFGAPPVGCLLVLHSTSLVLLLLISCVRCAGLIIYVPH